MNAPHLIFLRPPAHRERYIEYSHKYHEQLLFGRFFDPCVTPGGNELITKSNECPGTKGSVVWEYDHVPTRKTGGKVIEGWKCGPAAAAGIAGKYLPSSCRGNYP